MRIKASVSFWVGCGMILTGQSFISCQSSPAAPVDIVDPNAEISILAPKGGETFSIGDTLWVKWKLVGKGVDEVNAVNIQLSPDSGKTWIELFAKSIPLGDAKWGNAPWKILPELLISFS